MGSPYIGEIRMFAGNFAPAGWLFCDGSLLPISENETLFNLIGTTYGGDGQTTFALPNLCSRVPVHQGTCSADGIIYPLGEGQGVENVTLTVNQIPIHNHTVTAASNNAQDPGAQANVLSTATSMNVYVNDQGQPSEALSASSIAPTGGSQPHSNIQPFLCINFIISQFGVYPPRN
jgi:microcystin-dependent protein